MCASVISYLKFHCENVSIKCQSPAQVTSMQLDFDITFMLSTEGIHRVIRKQGGGIV